VVLRTKLTPHGSVEVRLDSGKQMSVKTQNLKRVTVAMTDDLAKDAQPPQEIIGRPGFKAGEIVVLKDMAQDNLNGQRAAIVNSTSRANSDRCAVKIISSGQKLSVTYEKIERLVAQADENVANCRVVKPAPSNEIPHSGSEACFQGMPAGKIIASPSSNTMSGDSKGAQSKQPAAVAEDLLEKMREVLLSNSETSLLEILDEVENAPHSIWGQLLSKKKQAMKKLRAKKRKMEADGPIAPESEGLIGAASEPLAVAELEPVTEVLESQHFSNPAPFQSDCMSDVDAQSVTAHSVTSDMWVLLDGEKPLDEWCQSLTLPLELLQRLKDEEVKSPSELAFVPEEDLKELVQGMKMGPKGRFLAAVKYLRSKR